MGTSFCAALNGLWEWISSTLIIIIIIIIESSGAHLPNRVMVSRHSTGFTHSLASNCLNTIMRGECAMCGRWAEFLPRRASGRCCLTFLTGFIALPGFPHGVLSSPTQWKEFADSPQVDYWTMFRFAQYVPEVTARHASDVASWPHCQVPLLSCTISVELCNIFSTPGPTTFPLSCFGFITFRAGWGHFIELCNILLQYQLLPPRRKRGVLSYGSWDS